MGTDDLGRDTLARIIHGAQVVAPGRSGRGRISLTAGLADRPARPPSTAGRFDLALMRVVDIMFAFPLLILAMLIAGLLGPSRTNAMIAIGIVYTPAFARVIRAAVLEVMGSPFIESARSLGARDLRIMRRHVLPNIVAPLTVLTTVYFSQAILAEATLSFLGLGTQPPEAAWGNMLATARSLHRRERLDVDLAGPRDHAHRPRLQLPRRRPPRHPRPADRRQRRRRRDPAKHDDESDRSGARPADPGRPRRRRQRRARPTAATSRSKAGRSPRSAASTGAAPSA